MRKRGKLTERQRRILRIAAFFTPPLFVTLVGLAWYLRHPAIGMTPDLQYSINTMKKVTPKTSEIGFTDVTQASGISYLQNTPALMKMSKCGATCMAMMMSGGAATTDADDDGDLDLLVTRMHAAPIFYRNKGDGTFEDATKEAGLDGIKNANGAGWADLDNDGDEDLYMTAVDDMRYYLYINDGKGRFTEEAERRGAAVFGLEHHQGYSVAFGDYDRDGWTDILTSQWGFDLRSSNMRLLRNLGPAKPGHFEDVTEHAGFAVRNEHVWYTLGRLEAALAEHYVTKLEDEGKISHERAMDATYYDGSYETTIPNDQSVYSGQFSFAPAFVDLDGDGWQDIAVASDFGTSHLFWNNGDGTFRDGTVDAGVSGEEHGMGSTFGDYDGDGKMDWFVTSIGIPENVCAKQDRQLDCMINSGNRLYRNLGNRKFEDATDKMGVRQGYWGWGTSFFDYDNDGDLDLVMTNGMNTKARYKDDPSRFWENVGKDVPMVERSKEVGLEDRGSGKGLITFDYDNDGDLDLFVVNDNASPRLMRNDGGSGNGWLKVKVRGTASNRDGFGALVEVRAGEGPAQVREIGASTHFLGQSDKTASFGLGRAATAEVRVTWPATGRTATFTDVPANSVLEAIEPRE
ncbi:MAG TPA: CRTAC1 family protein [Candidatus Eisenbacteria bacterium]|nr:CRTAC1 family protein [Candidatus Eisenbacteria bacterium]